MKKRFNRNNQNPVDLSFTWISGIEVMQILGISRNTLRTWRENGTVPFSKINRKIYYNRSDIDKMLIDNYSKE